MAAGQILRFGVVAVPDRNHPGASWCDYAQRVESQGWTSLLVPDTLRTVSPFPALAAAGAVTASLRLRPWVLAAPLRSPALVVRESSALQQLSDGRLEIGIGTGRPEAEGEAARLGVAWGSAAERIEVLERVVGAVREQVTPTPTMVIAAGGPRTLAVASRIADRVALALPPTATEADLVAMVEQVRAAGGMSVALQVVGVGDRLPSWLARQGTLDVAQLAVDGAVGLLPADGDAMADTLSRLHATCGVDEIVVPAELADAVAPVIGRLTKSG